MNLLSLILSNFLKVFEELFVDEARTSKDKAFNMSKVNHFVATVAFDKELF